MVISRFAFRNSVRLRNPEEYKRVFADPERQSDRYFTILARKNNLDYPRLGLAIAKKNIKRAVGRNLIKRIIRESFRLRQHEIGNLDVVVMARNGADSATPSMLRQSLDKIWLRLEKRCGSYSSKS
ncbi:MAG: ribonuclease P protein component [Gammaproteobacteria bacterium]